MHGLQWNREPLWPSNYTNTTTYQLITKLNGVSGPLLWRIEPALTIVIVSYETT